jgi:pimeloyl-ACP methyl ester carboxylesterase
VGDGFVLKGERWAGEGPIVILLHPGVADRRVWTEVALRLAPELDIVAYDRRGFGETPPSRRPFRHLDDVLAVLDGLGGGPAHLVGNSAGGGIAMDVCLEHPASVASLVLLAPAIGGAPDPDLDADTARFESLIRAADEEGDGGEVNRLETWLWLDGPAQREGRVGGDSRRLLTVMNAIALSNGSSDRSVAAETSAWERAGEISVPATVGCGDLDVPTILDESRKLAGRLPQGTFVEMTGCAHLPQLERPDLVAQIIARTVRRATPAAGP